MDIFSTTDSGLEPNKWEVKLFANVGASEEFMQQLMFEMPELVDACTIFEPRRQDAKEAILTISIEGLLPAFEHLKKIRASVQQTVPELNRKQHYEDFARVLWHAYKDLTPKATALMDFDIGFLFQNNANFEKGVTKFVAEHPSLLGLGPYLRQQRISWQDRLQSFRNHFLEHRKEEPEKFKNYYVPEWAEMVFAAVWHTIADVIAMLLTLRMQGFTITEIPVNERRPEHPRRFRFVLVGEQATGSRP
jgi:hypothetical protein